VEFQVSMKIKCEVSISRRSDNVIVVSVTDSGSRARFLEIEFTFDQFAQAVTGLHTSGVDASVNAMDFVGKKKVRESRKAVCPVLDHRKDSYVAWLQDNAQESGWTIDSYLGSQGSVRYNQDGTVTLNYSVFKHVDDAVEG